jgi:hypothetical protein
LDRAGLTRLSEDVHYTDLLTFRNNILQLTLRLLCPFTTAAFFSAACSEGARIIGISIPLSTD